MSIAVVVVTYNSASTLEECLQRLRAAAGVSQIRVVDNGSKDGTVAIVQRQALADARLHFIANLDNPGFAAACNQGAWDCDAPWLAFVNPDLMVEPDTLQRLANEAGQRGPCVLGAEQINEQGQLDPAVRRRDPDFSRMLRDPRGGMNLAVVKDVHQSVQSVQALSGALLVMSRALFDRLGGWDAGYRLHAEDLDLCRRAREAGALVAIVNDVQVLHIRGVSSQSRPFFVEWQKHRGLWRYFSRFEASRRGNFTCALVWLAIWGHGAWRIARQLLRAG